MRLWQHLVNQQAEAAAVSKTWRYWRIFVQTNNGGNLISLGEVQLRATVGGSDLTTTSTPVTASNAANAPVTNIRDNDTATLWATGVGVTTDSWVRLDLGTTQTVLQVAMYPQSTLLNRAPKDFIIQGSDDGTTFTDVKAFTDVTGWTTGWRTFDL